MGVHRRSAQGSDGAGAGEARRVTRRCRRETHRRRPPRSSARPIGSRRSPSHSSNTSWSCWAHPIATASRREISSTGCSRGDDETSSGPATWRVDGRASTTWTTRRAKMFPVPSRGVMARAVTGPRGGRRWHRLKTSTHAPSTNVRAAGKRAEDTEETEDSGRPRGSGSAREACTRTVRRRVTPRWNCAANRAARAGHRLVDAEAAASS